MFYLIYLISPFFLLVSSFDYYYQSSIISINIKDTYKKIIWGAQPLFLISYFFITLFYLFSEGSVFSLFIIKILLLFSCLIGLFQRFFKVLKTLEDILKGLLEFVLISYLLGGDQTSWIVSISVLILSANAGKIKLTSDLWRFNGSGLIRFLTAPWLARPFIRNKASYLYRNSLFFKNIIKYLNFFTPLIQLSSIVLFISVFFELNFLSNILLTLQLLFAIGLYLTVELKWIPFLYISLYLIYYLSIGITYNSLMTGIILSRFDIVCILFILIYSINSLTPDSKTNTFLYKFRAYTSFISFSAGPLRLFGERDLINMISYYIVGYKGLKFNSFNRLGFRTPEKLLNSSCQKICLIYPLSEFCYLSYLNKDIRNGFCSNNHKKQCNIILSNFSDSNIQFFQHKFIEEKAEYESIHVATLYINKNNDPEDLKFVFNGPVLPMARID